jgi:hypothetical protein
MPDVSTRRRLVGQPLLYGISVFASLGVFLVHMSYIVFLNVSHPVIASSSDMTKGMQLLYQGNTLF